jgi:uncharacterized protein
MKIKITAGTVEATAELDNSKTAQAIWKALPITARVDLWGNEIYFSIPVHVELENGKELVSAGDLGFWPEGDAFCIFFGRTPISGKDEIRPASAVNVFGHVVGETSLFKNVKSGSKITIGPM